MQPERIDGGSCSAKNSSAERLIGDAVQVLIVHRCACITDWRNRVIRARLAIKAHKSDAADQWGFVNENIQDRQDRARRTSRFELCCPFDFATDGWSSLGTIPVFDTADWGYARGRDQGIVP
jgi:hypothetical protein